MFQSGSGMISEQTADKKILDTLLEKSSEHNFTAGNLIIICTSIIQKPKVRWQPNINVMK